MGEIIDDGHTLTPVFIPYDQTLKFDVHCPFPGINHEAACGGDEACYIREALQMDGIDIIEGEPDKEYREFPLKIVYWWSGGPEEPELWLKPRD